MNPECGCCCCFVVGVRPSSVCAGSALLYSGSAARSSSSGRAPKPSARLRNLYRQGSRSACVEMRALSLQIQGTSGETTRKICVSPLHHSLYSVRSNAAPTVSGAARWRNAQSCTDTAKARSRECSSSSRRACTRSMLSPSRSERVNERRRQQQQRPRRSPWIKGGKKARVESRAGMPWVRASSLFQVIDQRLRPSTSTVESRHSERERGLRAARSTDAGAGCCCCGRRRRQSSCCSSSAGREFKVDGIARSRIDPLCRVLCLFFALLRCCCCADSRQRQPPITGLSLPSLGYTGSTSDRERRSECSESVLSFVHPACVCRVPV